jgi:hypothetical protein
MADGQVRALRDATTKLQRRRFPREDLPTWLIR